jgi:hypothetical protein
MKWTLEKLDKLEDQIEQLYKTTELSENTLADVMGKIDTERFKINQAKGIITGDELVLPTKNVSSSNYFKQGLIKQIFIRKRYKPFQCPHEDISCDKVNTATNTLEIQCSECEHYNNGVRFSKGCFNFKIFFWNDKKVIDFVNWYLKLNNLNFKYTLENKTIIDEFKKNN